MAYHGYLEHGGPLYPPLHLHLCRGYTERRVGHTCAGSSILCNGSLEYSRAHSVGCTPKEANRESHACVASSPLRTATAQMRTRGKGTLILKMSRCWSHHCHHILTICNKCLRLECSFNSLNYTKRHTAVVFHLYVMQCQHRSVSVIKLKSLSFYFCYRNQKKCHATVTWQFGIFISFMEWSSKL